MGSLGPAKGSLGSLVSARIHLEEPSGRRDHSSSGGLTWAGVVVFRFIRVLVGSVRRADGSLGSFGFARFH